eukprot:365492-Chlamydomonas_euryale.AAC.10
MSCSCWPTHLGWPTCTRALDRHSTMNGSTLPWLGAVSLVRARRERPLPTFRSRGRARLCGSRRSVITAAGLMGADGSKGADWGFGRARSWQQRSSRPGVWAALSRELRQAHGWGRRLRVDQYERAVPPQPHDGPRSLFAGLIDARGVASASASADPPCLLFLGNSPPPPPAAHAPGAAAAAHAPSAMATQQNGSHGLEFPGGCAAAAAGLCCSAVGRGRGGARFGYIAPRACNLGRPKHT